MTLGTEQNEGDSSNSKSNPDNLQTRGVLKKEIKKEVRGEVTKLGRRQTLDYMKRQ